MRDRFSTLSNPIAKSRLEGTEVRGLRRQWTTLSGNESENIEHPV